MNFLLKNPQISKFLSFEILWEPFNCIDYA